MVVEFQDACLCSEEVEVEGHLIDSMVLTRIFDRIMDLGGEFEVKEFTIGRRKTDYSYARLLVKGRDPEHLDRILKELYRLGAVQSRPAEAGIEPAPSDMILPDGFYSTTSHPTWIYLSGRWIEVENLTMDKVIVVENKGAGNVRAYCKSIREVEKGDLIVIGERGVRVKPPERPREGLGVFEFMSSRASPEKPSTSIILRIAEDLYKAKHGGERIVVVAGPAVIHTGASDALAGMIRLGYVHALLSGNALAVHDVEKALFGTSLGVDLKNGTSSLGGHRNHIAAINEVYKAGSLKAMVDKGILKNGIMYECIHRGVAYVLAGSIRDDGPLPEVITDTIKAQQEYMKALRRAGIVLMLASMLHSIAVGNLLPSTVKIICVDINPAVALKLLDRGTAQAVGVVSDVGVFLPLLLRELEDLEKRNNGYQPRRGCGKRSRKLSST
ncbi:MAG: TIGR00300 family protein [Candidatus Bathyarchaeia archaeon]